VDELIGQIRSVTRGIDTTDEIGMAVDEIKEHGHPSPGFLASDHTLKNMKRDIYYSDYTGRTDRSYEEWYDKAHTRVKQVLDRKPVGGKADATIEGRLSAVEARLREDNESWRKSLDAGIRWNRAVWRASDEEWWRFYVQDL
jgi:trimethylamine:corrinoid methyltransferase-like protein